MAFTLNTDAYGDHVLIIEGTAAVDERAPAWDANDAFAAKFGEAIVHWAIGDVHEVARDFSVPVRITPSRIRAW